MARRRTDRLAEFLNFTERKTKEVDEVIKSIDKEFSFYNDTFILKGIKYKLIFSYVASGKDVYNGATETEGTKRILDEALEKFYKYKVIGNHLIREEISTFFISSPHNSYFVDLALLDKNGEIHYIDNIISHIRDKFHIEVERSYLKKVLKASILLFTDFLSLSIYELEKSLKYLEGTVLQPYISVLCDMKGPVIDRLSIYKGLSIYGGILSAITPTLPGVFVDFETIRGRLIEFSVVNRYPIYMRPRMDIGKERESKILIREGLVYISKDSILEYFAKMRCFLNMVKLYNSVSRQERENTQFWRDMYEKECEKYNPFQFNLDIPDLAVGNNYQKFIHAIYTGIIIGLYSIFDPNIRKFLGNVKDVNERKW